MGWAGWLVLLLAWAAALTAAVGWAVTRLFPGHDDATPRHRS
jgi:hypothetical protein